MDLKRLNCIRYAWAAWRKAPPGEETYLIIRRSRVAWGFCHFLFGRLDPETGQINVLSYKPFTPEKRGIELSFEGRVVEGDKP